MTIPDKGWLTGWHAPYNDDLDRELFDPLAWDAPAAALQRLTDLLRIDLTPR